MVKINEQLMEKILNDYDNKMKISQIIEKYGLDIKINDFQKIIPPTLSEERCPYCNNNLILKKRTRIPKGKSNPPICTPCSHISLIHCSCDNCKKLEIEKFKRRIDSAIFKLRERNVKTDEPIIFSDLPLYEKFWIISFIVTLGDPQIEYIQRKPHLEKLIYPIPFISNYKFQDFLKKGYFLFDTIIEFDRIFESYEIPEKNKKYISNFDVSFSQLYYYKDLNIFSSEAEKRDYIMIDYKLKHDEIKSLLYIYAKKFNIAFTYEDRHFHLIVNMLRSFSFIQVLNFIDLTCSKVYSSNDLKSIPEKPIENDSLFLLMDNYSKSAIRNKWNLKGNHKPNHYFESGFRQIFDFFEPLD